MKFISSVLLVFLASSVACVADEASHRQVAADMIDVINGPAVLRAGIDSALDPMLEQLQSQGAPAAAIREIKAAVTEWVNKEIVWDEIRPKLIDLYAREFNEEELKALLAFYKTPVGAKALNRLPALFAEGAKIGQEYAETKQASLNARLEKIAEKYKDQLKAPEAAAEAAPETQADKPAEKPAADTTAPAPAQPEPKKK